MAATPEVRVTQGDALVALKASANESRATQLMALTAINFPSASERTAQVSGLVTTKSATPIRTAQAVVLVAIKLGAENKIMRAWTFTMDGHDFYVLHGGADFTYVWDKSTQQWATWNTNGLSTWRAGMGLNWDNEVVGGDLLNGVIWDIDPTEGADEDPEGGVFYPIQSYVMGFIGWRGRDPLPCFGVSLVGSQGGPVDATAYVQLQVSDDMSATFFDCGQIPTPLTGKHDYDLSWYSLGQVQSPGRIFMILDNGALERIDSLDLMEDLAAQNGNP